MVSDQRPLCPKGSPTEFTLIVLPAAVSDHVSFEDAGSFKCLLAELTHISPLLVHLQLHLDQLGGNVLLLGAALLLTDLPIHVAIGVLKHMVSCHNDLFDVPTAWEKVGRQLGPLQDRALPNPSHLLFHHVMQEEGEKVF